MNDPFIFSAENFRDPKLPAGLRILELEAAVATEESLQGYGSIVHDPNDFTVEKKSFEIVKWPVSGWRSLDPDTGDEAGTVEGDFEVHWQGDYYVGKNLAIATSNNTYLDGLGVPPEDASRTSTAGAGDNIYLWMSDYHPDGGQLFWSDNNVPFVMCLGLSSYGDDIRPEHMRAFSVPAGKGVYIHPGTWHNGVYVHKAYCPCRFLTRQGRVHARVSASWAGEFQALLKIALPKGGITSTESRYLHP
ncbi:unnamed protein product [Ectocarpus fasciculatus]